MGHHCFGLPWWLCLPIRETCVPPLGWEVLQEKEVAAYSSILASEIPWTEKPGGLQSMGLQKCQTWLSDQTPTAVVGLARCVSLCAAARWGSRLYTYIPPPSWALRPPTPSHRLGHHRALRWAPCLYSRELSISHTGHLFYTRLCIYLSVFLSQILPFFLFSLPSGFFLKCQKGSREGT